MPNPETGYQAFPHPNQVETGSGDAIKNQANKNEGDFAGKVKLSQGKTESINQASGSVKSHIQFGIVEVQDGKEHAQGQKQAQNDSRTEIKVPRQRETKPQGEMSEENLGGYVAQLCGSAALDQGFFYIEVTPCQHNVKDVSTLGLIKLIKGEAIAKKIEGEF